MGNAPMEEDRLKLSKKEEPPPSNDGKRQRRKSKWEEVNDQLANRKGPIGYKKIALNRTQICALLGRGGETIKFVRSQCTNAEIVIQSQRDAPWGVIQITGDVEEAEQQIVS